MGSDASNRDVIVATTDGGASWRVQYSGSGMNSKGQIGYSDVAFADARHGWVVGLDGTILATTDGGRTWKPQRSGTKLDLNGVAFADAKHGMVVGDDIEGDDPLAGKLDGSTILRTTDGGATGRSESPRRQLGAGYMAQLHAGSAEQHSRPMSAAVLFERSLHGSHRLPRLW